MSQADFLKYVVPNGFMPNEKLLECSIQIMKSVVENPGESKITQSETETRIHEAYIKLESFGLQCVPWLVNNLLRFSSTSKHLRNTLKLIYEKTRSLRSQYNNYTTICALFKGPLCFSCNMTLTRDFTSIWLTTLNL